MAITKRHRTLRVKVNGKETKTLGQQDAELHKLMKLYSAGKITFAELKKRDPRNASNPESMSLHQLFAKG